MDARRRPLDRTDHAILVALQNDARLSNKELAARVGLAPSSCLVRVQRLVADGVLAGFHARVDPSAVGVGLRAMVSLRLAEHDKGSFEALRRRALELEEVLDVFHVSGSEDLLIHIAVRDTDHLRSVVMDKLTDAAAIRQLETAIIFQHDRRAVLPVYE